VLGPSLDDPRAARSGDLCARWLAGAWEGGRLFAWFAPGAGRNLGPLFSGGGRNRRARIGWTRAPRRWCWAIGLVELDGGVFLILRPATTQQYHHQSHDQDQQQKYAGSNHDRQGGLILNRVSNRVNNLLDG